MSEQVPSAARGEGTCSEVPQAGEANRDTRRGGSMPRDATASGDGGGHLGRGYDNEEHPSGQDIAAMISEDVAKLRGALREEIEGLRPARSGGGALVALCGLPGTGKSHFAAALSQRLPCLVLGSDRMRKILVSRPVYDREEHRRVFDAAHCLLESLLAEGYRVVFDATNLTERAREPLSHMAARTGARLVFVQFDAPHGVVRQRLARRSRGEVDDAWSDADWRIYCRLYPGQEPIAGPHLRVDSSRDMEEALTEVIRLAGEGR